jgi:hypothetical protein
VLGCMLGCMLYGYVRRSRGRLGPSSHNRTQSARVYVRVYVVYALYGCLSVRVLGCMLGCLSVC